MGQGSVCCINHGVLCVCTTTGPHGGPFVFLLELKGFPVLHPIRAWNQEVCCCRAKYTELTGGKESLHTMLFSSKKKATATSMEVIKAAQLPQSAHGQRPSERSALRGRSSSLARFERSDSFSLTQAARGEAEGRARGTWHAARVEVRGSCEWAQLNLMAGLVGAYFDVLSEQNLNM